MPNHIVRRDPFESFAPIDRLFRGLFEREPLITNLATFEEGTLALDVSEDEHNVLVRASLPGFRKEDVQVEVHDGVLTINAGRTEESEDTGERFYRKERREGSVSRRIALPSPVVEDEARAELADGVLTLRLPKTQKETPKRIAIS